MSIEQETYNNMRSRWLTTADDSQALSQLKAMETYRNAHPEVKMAKVYFN
ncbi:MAG: hypothetical protein ACTSWW_04530 [Promethearchaeota archaeon]